MNDTKCSKKPVNQHKDFYKEYFNLGIVLRGEVNDLEEVKKYIITTFVDKRLVQLIKPTYKKEKLCIVNEHEYAELQRFNGKEKINDESECFHFACILRGEVNYLEAIKKWINQYKSVEIFVSTYEKDRLYIVEEFLWDKYKKTINDGEEMP